MKDPKQTDLNKRGVQSAKNVKGQPTMVTLERDEYEAWNQFVSSSPQGNIYCRTPYLDAIECAYRIEVVKLDGRIRSGIVLTRNRFGLYVNPLLVKYLGVLHERKNPHAAHYEELLGNNLSRWNVWSYSFSPEYRNWLPLYWQGFSQTTRYTYQLLPDGEVIRDGYDSALRRLLNKARRNGLVIREISSQSFAEEIRKTYRQKRQHCPFSYNFMTRVIDKLEAAGLFYKRSACLPDGTVLAVGGVVYDQASANLVLHGMDRNFRESGANAFVIDHLIDYASHHSRVFDFEGSMIKNIERFYRRFGGQLTPYSEIRNSSLQSGLYIRARDLARWLNR